MWQKIKENWINNEAAVMQIYPEWNNKVRYVSSSQIDGLIKEHMLSSQLKFIIRCQMQ